MKKIDEFIPIAPPMVLYTLGEEETKTHLRKRNRWWKKHLKGFKQTWDFNSDGGLKHIYQKGRQIRMVTFVYGHMTIYKLSKKEMEDELKSEADDSFDNWEKVKQ